MAGGRTRRGDVADLAGSVGLGAWAGFGVLTMIVVGGDGTPMTWDAAALSWSVGHRTAVALALARGLTATGTGVVAYGLVILAGILLGRTARHRLAWAALAVGCLAAGQAVRFGLMTLVHRERPAQADWRTAASGWSFPSGHTTTAALTAGLLVVALLLRGPRGRVPLVAVVACWGLLVGLTRVYLGVHWLSDVLGGWLLGVGWLGLCLCAAAWWLPDRLVAGATGRAPLPLEDRAPQDSARGGRSRPA
ncbi:phosphatase PAP2 family protein [Streptomyces sp. NPDC050400]|uniref:phosphatase PAP2 family protein n=1 Tax=Streptomyces sp. NPDC050400 TaxID=3365610 RepID=UPI0037A4D4D7